MDRKTRFGAGVFSVILGLVCLAIGVPLLVTTDLALPSARYPSFSTGVVLIAVLVAGAAGLITGLVLVIRHRGR